MTPEQAIQFLDQVTAQLTVNRQVHMQISQALQVIKSELTSKVVKDSLPSAAKETAQK